MIKAAEPNADALLSEQARLLARQVRKSPYAVLIVAGCIVYGVHTDVPASLAYAWFGLVALCLLMRRLYAGHVLRQDGLTDLRNRMRTLVFFALLNGAAIGASAPLFFSTLSDTARAIISMVLVGLSAGGIATSAAYRPAFAAYTLPALLPLAFSWFAVGGTQRILIGVLVILFMLILFTFVRENHQLLLESFSIRFEREKLVKALEHEHSLALAAKEKAEEAGRAKARVLAAASHDLRQPLHALSLYSAILARRPTAETLSTVSQHIDLSVRSLGALLNALLDVSKLDAGVYEIEKCSFDIAEVLQRVCTDHVGMASQKGLTLELESVSLVLYSDPIVIERIVRNLIDNAIKYTDSGRIGVCARREQDTLLLEIEDSGKGIPPDEQDRIFEEFYQLDNPGRDREKGLGLGLSIVKRLTHLIGARISLRSTPGKGSYFAVHVPIENEVASPQPRVLQPLEMKSGDLDGARILIIDDEASIRQGMSLLLESWGAEPFSAASEQEAEKIMETLAAKIDLIIADLRLQGGADGMQVIDSLQKAWGTCPVLLISGETDPAKLKDATASGFPLLHKPISAEALQQNVIKSLSSVQ